MYSKLKEIHAKSTGIGKEVMRSRDIQQAVLTQKGMCLHAENKELVERKD